MNAESVRVWRGSSEWHDLVPRLLLEHGSRRVVEIGVWRGELSARILQECSQLTSLLLVDPWKPSVLVTETNRWLLAGPGLTQQEMEEAFLDTMTRIRPYAKKVGVLRMPSVEAAKQIPDRSFDAVIIDALHFQNTVIEDITAWRTKLRPGGLMIGDDYNDFYPGVSIGVHTIFGPHHRVLGQTWWTFPDRVPPQPKEAPCSAACR